MPTSKDSNTTALAFLRIAVGLFFIVFGQYKVFGTAFTLHGGFAHYIAGFIQNGAFPFMVPILRVILAHFATPMAFLVAYGELLIGISLVTGVFSRLASFFGFALMMAMWMSGGNPGPHAAFWMYWGASLDWSVFAACFLAFMLGRPDDLWSLRPARSRSRR
jgi:thiosulfate dehydrogenase [quinone] large subunit